MPTTGILERKDKRFDNRDNDRRYYRREDNRYFAYSPEYRRGGEREMHYGHYIVDRCGRKMFL